MQRFLESCSRVFVSTVLVVGVILWALPVSGRTGIPDWDRSIPAAVEGENAAVYFSNGDNEIFYTAPPIDSPEAIDEMLDVLKKAYGVKRIYWRAPQIEQLIYYGKVRDEAAHHGPWAKWMDYLFDELGTGDHMIRAAKARGMEVWGVAALFDHGSQAFIEYPTKGQGPFFTESFVRLNHPEAIPVDRAGIRRMSGPVSFAYPEARLALVKLYVALVRDKGYDGLNFHLYVENQGTRFDDEFGFNDPIVEAYKDRHGVDIRSEFYDKELLAKLRGEYLTQFFRELRKAMQPLGVEIGVTLGAKYPDQPQRWLAFRDSMLSGRIQVDWRAYAREGLVDEIFVYFDGDPMPTVRQVIKEVGDTGVALATISSAGFPESSHDLRDAGVWRIISGQSEELEYGYHQHQSANALDGDDFVARLSVLTQMGAGTTELDINRVIAATRDPSILVRRRALRLLVTIGQSQPQHITPEVIDAVIERLDDPQNIVRCTAVNTLANIGDSASMPALYDAIGRHANPMMHLITTAPLASLPEERTDDLILGLRHPSPDARIVAIRNVGGGRARPEAWPALIENASHAEWLVRWNVARALEHIRTPESITCLRQLLDDPHPTVRSMAVRNFSLRLHSDTRWVGGSYVYAVDKLAGMFAEYGDGSTRVDADWGWRTIGEALARMGPRGSEVLEGYLNQDDDKLLAERAWSVLYVKQDAFKIIKITEEEAEAGYRMHPSRRESPASKTEAPPEPEWMPYIVQNFDGEDAIVDEKGEIGNPISHEGGWRNVNLVAASAATHGTSLRVAGGDGAESIPYGFRRDYRLRGGMLRASFAILRQEPHSGVTVWLTSSHQWQGNLRVQVGPDGEVVYFNGDGRTIRTNYQVEPETWYRFEITADIDRGTFSLFALTPGGRTALASDIPIADAYEINTFLVMPGGEGGSSCLVDDVQWLVTNPSADRPPSP
jgi:HEAT repeat protein